MSCLSLSTSRVFLYTSFVLFRFLRALQQNRAQSRFLYLLSNTFSIYLWELSVSSASINSYQWVYVKSCMGDNAEKYIYIKGSIVFMSLWTLALLITSSFTETQTKLTWFCWNRLPRFRGFQVNWLPLGSCDPFCQQHEYLIHEG